MPKCDSRGLFIGLAWDAREVKLYLGGISLAKEVAKADISMH